MLIVQDKMHQYEVIVQTSTTNFRKPNAGDKEVYTISPYCVTYFGKNARRNLEEINEEPDRIVADKKNYF